MPIALAACRATVQVLLLLLVLLDDWVVLVSSWTWVYGTSGMGLTE